MLVVLLNTIWPHAALTSDHGISYDAKNSACDEWTIYNFANGIHKDSEVIKVIGICNLSPHTHALPLSLPFCVQLFLFNHLTLPSSGAGWGNGKFCAPWTVYPSTAVVRKLPVYTYGQIGPICRLHLTIGAKSYTHPQLPCHFRQVLSQCICAIDGACW